MNSSTTTSGIYDPQAGWYIESDPLEHQGTSTLYVSSVAYEPFGRSTPLTYDGNRLTQTLGGVTTNYTYGTGTIC